jgi:hypothetical protein
MPPHRPSSFGRAATGRSYWRNQAFAVWRLPESPRIVRAMTTNDTVLAIATRHVADSDEGGRTCRACGRPWPCDVRLIVAAIEASPWKTRTIAGLTTNGVTRRVASPVAPSRSRRRLPTTPTVAS